MSLAVALAAALVAAVVIWYLYPEETERWLVRFLTAKRIVFGLAAIIFGLFLLSTGAFGLMLLGAVLIIVFVLYFLCDPDGYVDQHLPFP